VVSSVEMRVDIDHLGMAVVANGDAVIGACLFDLVDLEFAVFTACFGQSALQCPAAASAAVIIRPVGGHVDKIFFAHNRLQREPQTLRDGIPELFAHQIARIVYGELFLQVLVPVRIDLQFTLSDPFGVVFDDALALEVMLDVELLQSGPDREQLVPSLGIEPDLTAEVIDRPGF